MKGGCTICKMADKSRPKEYIYIWCTFGMWYTLFVQMPGHWQWLIQYQDVQLIQSGGGGSFVKWIEEITNICVAFWYSYCSSILFSHESLIVDYS